MKLSELEFWKFVEFLEFEKFFNSINSGSDNNVLFLCLYQRQFHKQIINANRLPLSGLF